MIWFSMCPIDLSLKIALLEIFKCPWKFFVSVGTVLLKYSQTWYNDQNLPMWQKNICRRGKTSRVNMTQSYLVTEEK